MRSWFPLAEFVALLCLLLIIGNEYKQIDIYNEQYNEQRLIKAVEYSAEAAFIDSIVASENLTDYEAINALVTTSKTLPTFDDMMELNYGLVRSDTSNIAIEDAIGVMCLVSDTGFYITDMVEVAPNQFRLTWSPKIPYSAELTRASDGKTDTVAVCLTTEKNWVCDNTTAELTTAQNFGDRRTIWFAPKSEPTDGLTTVLNETLAKNIISNSITDALSYRLSNNRFVDRTGDIEYSVYIPSSQTYSGINNIDSPTLLVVMNNAKFSGYEGRCSVFQGLKITWKPRVVGYVDPATGIRKYCYEGQSAYTLTSSITTIPFDSVEDAARAGYYPDIDALMKPIVYTYR